MYLKGNKSTIFLTKDREIEAIPVLFIHGFTGNSKSWNPIRKELNINSISIDIPGHGKSSFNNLKDDYFFKDFSNELYLTLSKAKISKLHLCGYSLGGRLSTTFAAKYPEMISSLTIESSSLGIEDRVEREERYLKDINIANSILENHLEFNRNWEENKLFEKQIERNEEDFNDQREIRSSHNKEQLSKALKTFSVGNMPFMLNNFKKFDFPIHIINGKDDTKYIKEGRVMLNINNNAKQYIVNNASHNVHLENKEMYLDILNDIYN